MRKDIEAEWTINPAEYRESINSGKEFYLQFHNYTEEIDAILVRLVHRYLEKYDLIYLRDTLLAVVRELVNNALKANIKRLYFRLKKLDINNPEEYRQGMETFKAEVYSDKDQPFFRELEKSNLIIRVAFKTTTQAIHISTINNIPIIDAELKKINSRIKKAYRYEDISDAFDDVLDDSEGAGLGLIMSLMLLKNIGLEASSFKMYRKNDLTISTLTIPKDYSPREKQVKVIEEILKEIEEMPAFPGTIQEIRRLCDQKESTMKDIAQAVSLDPGVAVSLLKLANSAGYMVSGKVDSIDDAVKIVGIKGVKTLLIASGVTDILESRYRQFKRIWDDSQKRAFYAGRLTPAGGKKINTEFVYLAALLADMGLIIIRSLNPKRIETLLDIMGHKKIDDISLIEEISLGISHSTLGARICEKWQFGEALSTAIDYHHRPYVAPEKYRDLIYAVNLADTLVETDRGRAGFDTLDEGVAEFFGITDAADFTALHARLKGVYEKFLIGAEPSL